MRAERIYAALDRAGLTPPVHYCAAPHIWRATLESLEDEIEDAIWKRVDALEHEIEAARKAKK